MQYRLTVSELVQYLVKDGYLNPVIEEKHRLVAEAIIRTNADLRAELECLVIDPKFSFGEES